MLRFTVLILVMLELAACSAAEYRLGNEREDILLPYLRNQRVALVVNPTSMVRDQHLIDAMLERSVHVTTLFALEHGIRGDADAGAPVGDSIDERTHIPIYSLYGTIQRPSASHLANVDVIVYDIQDVGVRFFTFISGLKGIMESAAEHGKTIIILDRPNPNDYIDGPVLDTRFQSYVGAYPIPLAYGLTVGELALMANGEGWLKNGVRASLRVIPMTGYRHGMSVDIPVRPSPNLRNFNAIQLYPSLALFEGTDFSMGRGTAFPFQVLGAPNPIFGDFTFRPERDVQAGKTCFGMDLRQTSHDFSLRYILEMYKRSGFSSSFISNARWFDLLAGTDELRIQIYKRLSEDAIRSSWEGNLQRYRDRRQHYLLYP